MKRSLFFLLVVFSSRANAQDSLLYPMLVPHHAVKISPFHLVSFYPTIQLAYEVKMARRATIQLEGGYVLDYPTNINDDYRDKRGVKAKLELHYYMLPSRRANLVYYGALELYWNAVDFDRLTTQTECFDANCNHTFTRQYWYTVNYREPGFGFKLGFVKYFSDFFMDINSGWGVRFITYSSEPEMSFGPVTDVMGWQSFSPNEEDRTALSPIVGMRFGYRIR
jgi:hypothetical protein